MRKLKKIVIMSFLNAMVLFAISSAEKLETFATSSLGFLKSEKILSTFRRGRGMDKDINGKLYISGGGKNIYIFDGTTLPCTKIVVPNNPAGEVGKVFNIAIGANRELWVRGNNTVASGQENFIAKYDWRKWETFDEKSENYPFDHPENPTMIVSTPNGGINVIGYDMDLAGKSKSCFASYNQTVWNSYVIEDSISINVRYLNGISEGKDGIIWLSAYSGLLKFANNKISIVDSSVSIETMGIGFDNYPWLGLFSGFHKYTGTKFEAIDSVATKNLLNRVSYPPTEADFNNHLQYIWADSIGLVKYNGVAYSLCSAVEQVKNEKIHTLLMGKNGNLWMASETNLYRYIPDNVEHPETVTVSIPSDQTFKVKEHSSGGTVVGDISIASSNLSKTKIKIINTVPEFEVDPQTPFTIKVTNGANLDYNTQKSYLLTVVTYAESGIIATPDTSTVTVYILQKTGVVEKSNIGISKKLITFSVMGNDLIITGISNDKYSLRINNIKGESILVNSNRGCAAIDISNISSGIYIASIISGNKKVLKKICINR